MTSFLTGFITYQQDSSTSDSVYGIFIKGCERRTQKQKFDLLPSPYWWTFKYFIIVFSVIFLYFEIIFALIFIRTSSIVKTRDLYLAMKKYYYYEARWPFFPIYGSFDRWALKYCITIYWILLWYVPQIKLKISISPWAKVNIAGLSYDFRPPSKNTDPMTEWYLYLEYIISHQDAFNCGNPNCLALLDKNLKIFNSIYQDVLVRSQHIQSFIVVEIFP